MRGVAGSTAATVLWLLLLPAIAACALMWILIRFGLAYRAEGRINANEQWVEPSTRESAIEFAEPRN